MKEEQYGQDDYLSEYTEYDKASLRELYESLLSKMEDAEKSGLKNVFVQFSSTLDPYEDCSLGPVQVQTIGHRELNLWEKAQQLEQERIQNLATKLGITFYEAGVVDKLEKQKKVKL